MKKFFYIVPALFALWVCFSFCEIVAGNVSPDPEYWRYNAFVVLSQIMHA